MTARDTEPAGGVPSLAVGILTRDRWDAVDACLASVHDQAAAAGVPVVVLVNGSGDDSAERIRAAYPGVEVRQSPTNLGCPGGRNLLMDVCRADWVVHLDDDGTVEPGFVARARAEVVAAPADRAVVAGVVVDPDAPPGAPVPPSGPTGTFSGGICALRRADFLRVGGYPDDGLRQGEEAELSVKLHDAGLRIHRAADLVLRHPTGVDPAKRRELLRSGLRQSLLTGLRFCPWWMLPGWTAWKLLIYLRLAIRLRALRPFLAGLGDVVRPLPAVLRTRRPARARAVLAASGRFGAGPG